MEKTDVRINKLLTPAGQGFDGGVCVGGYLGFQRVERREAAFSPDSVREQQRERLAVKVSFPTDEMRFHGG